MDAGGRVPEPALRPFHSRRGLVIENHSRAGRRQNEAQIEQGTGSGLGRMHQQRDQHVHQGSARELPSTAFGTGKTNQICRSNSHCAPTRSTLFAKRVSIRRTRVQGHIDVYNVFNADTILRQNNTYATAATCQAPTAIMSPFVKFGVQVDF